jgi:hypothetical protein
MSTLDRNEIDPELIARVLDGRASQAERTRVLAAADKSPELLELLADSAAALNDGVDDKAQVIALRPRRVSSRTWMGIAAVLVAAATIPMWWSSSSTIPALPLREVGNPAALGAARAGPLISTQRGLADDRIAKSVIVGTRLVDYMMLGADTARGTAAVEIASALRGITGGAVAASRFDLPGPVTGETMEAIEQVVDVPVFRAAAWAEAARLAALGNDDATIREGGLRRAFEAAAANRTFSDEARGIARQVVVAIDAMDRSAVSDLTGRFLGELTRR